MTGALTNRKIDGLGALWIAGLILLIVNIAIIHMSQQFVFGTGFGRRPIISFLLCSYAAFGVYLFAIYHATKAAFHKGALFWIMAISILIRLLFFQSQIIQETDPYRYIWDGQSILNKVNPYLHSPLDAAENNSGPAGADSAGAQATFARINHPAVKTIYPPFSQLLFTLSQWLTPWSLFGWRMMILIAECLTLLLLVKTCAALSLPLSRVMIYGWSPLVIKEFSNSLHVDAFAVLFLTAVIHAVANKNWISAFAFLAFVTLTKIFGIILLPLLILFASKESRRQTMIGVAVFTALVISFCVPFASAGFSAFNGLIEFGTTWHVNAGIFSLMKMIFAAIGGNGDIELRICLALALAGTVGGILVAFLDRKNAFAFIKAGLLTIAALFFLTPAGNPWYFTWMLPFLVFWPVKSLIGFSGLVLLYYLDFFFMYRDNPDLFHWVIAAEYGLFLLVLGWELCKKNKLSPSLFLFSTK